MCIECSNNSDKSEYCKCKCSDEKIVYDRAGGDLFYCDECEHHISTRSPNLRKYATMNLPERAIRAKEGSVYYFAYGSNLNTDQMKSRLGEWERTENCELYGYKLTFDKHSENWDGGVADIIKTDNENDVVDGAIYLISTEQMKKMDEKEGGYRKIDSLVTTYETGKARFRFAAKTYEVIKKGDFETPSDRYLQTIVKGLIQHNITAVHRIERILRAAQYKEDALSFMKKFGV